MRVRGFPFGDEVRGLPRTSTSTIFVVEQNRDAQLRSLLTLETRRAVAKLISVLDYGGFPMHARIVIDAVSAASRWSARMTYIAKPKVQHPSLAHERASG